MPLMANYLPIIGTFIPNLRPKGLISSPPQRRPRNCTLHGVVFQKTERPPRSPQFPAREPALAAAVERFHRGAVEAGHVGLDLVADPGLEIGEMPVALGKLHQEDGVEFEPGGGIDGVEAVLLVDRLAQHQAPAPIALLEEVVEAAGADDV